MDYGVFYLKVTRYPKNVYSIMANVKLLFYGTEKTQTQDVSIQCFYNVKNEISVVITDKESTEIISMDKPTAIKFSRELRKHIALISDVPF